MSRTRGGTKQEKKKKNQSSALCDLPDAEKFGLLARSRRLRLHLQRVDVGDGDDGGGHVPRQAHEGADHHEDGHPEEVQVIASTFLESRREKLVVTHQGGGSPAFNDPVVALWRH